VAERRRRADDALLMALVCGATVEVAARNVGLGVATVYRRLQEQRFKARLQHMRSEMVQRAAGMLTASAMEAVKTLLSLQEHTVTAAVRLGAARTILEMGIKLRENADLEERLAALERQLGAGTAVLPPPEPPESTAPESLPESEGPPGMAA
jgi:hypothetical protein